MRDFKKENDIIREMLQKGIDSKLVLETMNLFESYALELKETEIVKEAEVIKETNVQVRKEEDKEVLIGEIVEESEPVNNSEIDTVEKRIRRHRKRRISLGISEVDKKFNEIIEMIESSRALLSSPFYNGKIFYGCSDDLNITKLIFQIGDKNLMLQFFRFIENLKDKKIVKHIDNFKSVPSIPVEIRKTKYGFKIDFDKKSSENTVGIQYFRRIKETMNVNFFSSIIIKDTPEYIHKLFNNSYGVCNQVKFDGTAIEFIFSNITRSIEYNSVVALNLVKYKSGIEPYRLIFRNCGINGKLKRTVGKNYLKYNEFNTKFDPELYNSYMNNNILVIIPKNKTIKNEFIKNFMINKDVIKVDIENYVLQNKNTTNEKTIFLPNRVKEIFNSKVEPLYTLIENDFIKSNTINLTFSIHTKHILDEDCWIFSFNNLSLNNLITK